jgi:hypothetical protein
VENIVRVINMRKVRSADQGFLGNNMHGGRKMRQEERLYKTEKSKQGAFEEDSFSVRGKG